MRRLGRILLNVATALSLVLLAATLALWARSQWIIDNVQRAQTARRDGEIRVDGHAVISERAGVWLLWVRSQQTPGLFWDQELRRAQELGERPQWTWKVSRAASSYATPAPRADLQRWGPLRLEIRDQLLSNHAMQWRGAWVPYWAVVLVWAILPVARVVGRLVNRRGQSGLCPVCGYDLRATPARCPECGWDAVSGRA
jgi:hypothetical protein